LAAAGRSFQRTRTWKASPDPDYEAKAARILALCATSPPDGLVISFDQMGPVSLRATAEGRMGARGRPERQRADDNRRHTRYVFAAYECTPTASKSGSGRADGAATCSRSCARSAPAPVAQAHLLDPRQPLGQLDARHPRFADDHNVELVPTPTYASYLNPVKCHFSALTESSSPTPTT
jgi:hypothetical protein